jgi:membrane protein YqaA with SNARE-associated domain
MKLDAASLIHRWGIPLATLIYCYVSGLVPVVNAEAFLVIISSALLTKSELVLTAAVAAAGQMAAKSTMYVVVRTSFRHPPKKYEGQLARAREKFARWRYGTGVFLFASAASGFPPFYAVSIMSGMLKINFLTFLLCGLAGRFLRFGAALLFPQLIKSLF